MREFVPERANGKAGPLDVDFMTRMGIIETVSGFVGGIQMRPTST